jgi:hypothetical protein
VGGRAGRKAAIQGTARREYTYGTRERNVGRQMMNERAPVFRVLLPPPIAAIIGSRLFFSRVYARHMHLTRTRRQFNGQWERRNGSESAHPLSGDPINKRR